MAPTSVTEYAWALKFNMKPGKDGGVKFSESATIKSELEVSFGKTLHRCCITQMLHIFKGGSGKEKRITGEIKKKRRERRMEWHMCHICKT